MKRIYTPLVLTMALALGMSSVAGADEHRGRGHRDGARHTHVEKRHNDSNFRAAPRRDWRPGRHWRSGNDVRRPWRALRRHGYRPAPGYRSGGRYSYRRNSYRPGTLRHYGRNTVSVRLNGVRFTMADSR